MNTVGKTGESPLLFVGVDVGGTNVKVGIVDDAGEMVADTAFPTEQEKGPAYAIKKSHTVVSQLLEAGGLDYSQVGSVGLGTPGPMDIPNGLILNPSNLPGWRDFPVPRPVAVVPVLALNVRLLFWRNPGYR